MFDEPPEPPAPLSQRGLRTRIRLPSANVQFTGVLFVVAGFSVTVDCGPVWMLKRYFFAPYSFHWIN